MDAAFGIATLFSFIILALRYKKDGSRPLLVLGVIVLAAQAVSYKMKSYDSFTKYESLHHENQSLAAENKAMARDLQFAKAAAVMHMGGGL